jgi:hypothetical protein
VGKRVAQKPLALARVYLLVPGKLEGGSEVLASTTLILGFEALVLFDLGVTHSFVRLSRLIVRTLELGLAIITPVGKIVVCKRVICECPVSFCGRVLLANLVILHMFSYDIILIMDWLTRHSTVINCARKQVTLIL